MLRNRSLIDILPERRALALAMLINVGAWFLVAVLFAGQGLLIAAMRGTRQPWWPSFGYSAAIFSVWALLTPLIALVAEQVEARVRGWSRRLFLYVAGLPLACALHVGLFSVLFWPVYADADRWPTRASFASSMFVRNIDLDSVFYGAIIAGVLLWRRRKASPHRQTTPSQPLEARIRGGVRLIALDTIDWIGAAGDYTEVHAGPRIELVDESLAALEMRLPSDEFARIHRSVIVRRDRVVEVRSAGRGDALVQMADGNKLRLSRRYRANLMQERSRLAVATIPLGENV